LKDAVRARSVSRYWRAQALASNKPASSKGCSLLHDETFAEPRWKFSFEPIPANTHRQESAASGRLSKSLATEKLGGKRANAK
jgi:hypothetical protein